MNSLRSTYSQQSLLRRFSSLSSASTRRIISIHTVPTTSAKFSLVFGFFAVWMIRAGIAASIHSNRSLLRIAGVTSTVSSKGYLPDARTASIKHRSSLICPSSDFRTPRATTLSYSIGASLSNFESPVLSSPAGSRKTLFSKRYEPLSQKYQSCTSRNSAVSGRSSIRNQRSLVTMMKTKTARTMSTTAVHAAGSNATEEEVIFEGGRKRELAQTTGKCATTVGFATDVEGNWDYWNRYIAFSDVLSRSSAVSDDTNMSSSAVSTDADAAAADADAAAYAAPSKIDLARASATVILDYNDIKENATEGKDRKDGKERYAASLGREGGGSEGGRGRGRQTLLLKENAHFVYGGDAWDRGPGDIRVMRDLISLKRRYPDRVHFVLGNRDINKLRVLFSIQAEKVGLPKRVYWLRGDQNSASLSEESSEISGKTRKEERSATEKMKWMLKNTMGAPLAFEYRREEIAVLKAQNLGISDKHDLGEIAVSDEEVLDSYMQLMHPEKGLMTEFLAHGKICVVLGDTLFLHGAKHPYNMGWLPYSAQQSLRRAGQSIPKPAELATEPTLKRSRSGEMWDNLADLTPESSGFGERVRGNVREWAASINQFVADEMRDYRENAAQFLQDLAEESPETLSIWELGGGYAHNQPGSRLLQYGMGWLPDKSLNPSVVYSTYLNMGKPPSRKDLSTQNTENRARNPPKTLKASTLGTFGGSASSSSASTTTTATTALMQGSENTENTADIDDGDDDDAFLLRWLNSSGIARLIVGHQPNGDCPFVMQKYSSSSSSSYSAPVSALAAVTTTTTAETSASTSTTTTTTAVTTSAGTATDAAKKRVKEQRYLQILCGDTSYSAHTQWPLSQLQQLFPQHAQTPPEKCSTETANARALEGNINSGSDALLYSIAEKQPKTDEKWLSYSAFAQENPVSSGDTRGPYCMSEILLLFSPENNNNNRDIDYHLKRDLARSDGKEHRKSSGDEDTLLKSDAVVRGVFSIPGLSYQYRLPSCPSSIDWGNTSIAETVGGSSQNGGFLVGHETLEDGWFVKAACVQLCERAEKGANEGGELEGGRECLLVGQSEGHTFRSRLTILRPSTSSDHTAS